jgi:hypothetical protein
MLTLLLLSRIIYYKKCYFCWRYHTYTLQKIRSFLTILNIKDVMLIFKILLQQIYALLTTEKILFQSKSFEIEIEQPKYNEY